MAINEPLTTPPGNCRAIIIDRLPYIALASKVGSAGSRRWEPGNVLFSSRKENRRVIVVDVVETPDEITPLLSRTLQAESSRPTRDVSIMRVINVRA